ncbi:MAG: hypothetical protein ACOZBL_04290 [Patescibacteria group bacterium]
MSKFVDEIKKLKMDNIIVSSSDFNRWWDDSSLIMANVNSYSSLDYIMKYILN